MKLRLFLALILIVILTGCAVLRQSALDASKEDLANAEVCRQIADNMTLTWSLNSGVIQCGLGTAFEEARIYPTVLKMDKLVKDMGKWSDTDYQKGCLLGYEAKLAVKSMEDLTKRITELITTYGPLVGL